MGVLTKRIQVVNVSTKGLVFALLAAITIVALFLIPDFIGTGRRASSTRTARVSAVPAPVQERHSPLQQLLEEVEAGAYSRKAGQAEAVRSAEGTQQAKPLLNEATATWDSIRSDPSREAIAHARDVAKQMQQEPRASDQRVKYALADFVNGVNFVLGDAEKTMSPREALRYLRRLDLAVAGSLRANHGSRSLYLRWADVSLAPALGALATDEAKRQATPAFDPHLQLTYVEIVGTPYTGRDGKEHFHTLLAIEGELDASDEITKLSMYRNGRHVTDIPILEKDGGSRRAFNALHGDASGTIALRVYEKNGAFYERTYNFFPRVRSFPQDQRGMFEIPFSGLEDPKAIEQLNRFFFLGEHKPGDEDPGVNFVRF